ncbi:hypothetical protein Tco_1361323 [Tanacetum coccineum]
MEQIGLKMLMTSTLCSDLRTMLDPPLNEDAIWSLPLQHKMINWRDFKNHLSDNEESLGDDASKQGRIDISDIDTDAQITLIDETQGRINNIVAKEDITMIPKLIIKQLRM